MKASKGLMFVIVLSVSFILNHSVQASNSIKVMDIESGEIVKEKEVSDTIEKEIPKIIKSISNITVEANPVPKKGYLIKVPLTKSLKVKNKWFDEIINEVIIVYSSEPNTPQKIIMFTDENQPMFFDIEYDLVRLLKDLEISQNES